MRGSSPGDYIIKKLLHMARLYVILEKLNNTCLIVFSERLSFFLRSINSNLKFLLCWLKQILPVSVQNKHTFIIILHSS